MASPGAARVAGTGWGEAAAECCQGVAALSPPTRCTLSWVTARVGRWTAADGVPHTAAGPTDAVKENWTST